MSEQIKTKPSKEDFKSYVCCQALGRWNMLSRNAREYVGIERPKYDYILDHYEELSKEFGITPESKEVADYVELANKYGF